MCISPKIAKWLRSMGYDAVHLSERNLQTLSDCDVKKIEKKKSRILLTMDLDFSRLAASVGIANLPLVIIFRLKDQSPLNIKNRLFVILGTLQSLFSQGNAVIIVNENKIRTRRLPIDTAQ
jgi:predicted nuclease of predicted toxin-antitoxin system